MTGAAEVSATLEREGPKLAVDNSQTPSPAEGAEEDRPGAPNLRALLTDAEQLLLYAAESGTAVEDTVVETIIVSVKKDTLTDKEALAAIKAVTSLSATLKPVTADTLRISSKEADKTLRTYFRFALFLGIPLIFISALSFVAASLSRSIGDEITTANKLAVTLNAQNRDQTAQPQATITDIETLTSLQLFAAAIRKVEGLA